MRRFWAVTAREVGEWRLALFAAPLLGLVPLVAPWLPGASPATRGELRAAVLLVLVAAFEVLLVLFLGSGIVSREEREGRLGFYFSRPVPAATLWLGKLSGAAVVMLLSGVLIGLPTLLGTQAGAAGPDMTSVVRQGRGLLGYLDRDVPDWPLLAPKEGTWLLGFEPEGAPKRSAAATILGWFFGGVLVIVAVHVTNILVRRRNAWLLLDLTALAVTLAVGWAAVDRLVSAQAMGPLIRAERFLLAGITLGAVAAGGVALSAGRCDAERSRRLLSTTLWSVVLVAAVGFFGYAHRSLAVDMDDLVAWAPEVSPDGEWILVSGPTRSWGGYRAAFLRHIRSGRTVELGPAMMARFHLTTSRDGSTAVWMRCRRVASPDCELRTLKLGAGDGRPRATGIPGRPLRRVTLSPDGRQVAVVRHISWSRNEVAVYDLDSGQVTTAVRVGFVAASEFLDNGRLRLYTQKDGRSSDMEIQELELASRRLSKTGEVVDFSSEILLHPFADVFLRVGYAPRGLEVYRADTGELLARHPGIAYGTDRVRFLTDGRTVVPGRDEEGPALFVLAADGSFERRVAVPGLYPLPGAEITPEHLVVGLKTAGGREIHVLDAESGALERKATGFQPLADQETRPFSTATRLLWSDDDGVVLWDEESGETTPVLVATQEMRRRSGGRRPRF